MSGNKERVVTYDKGEIEIVDMGIEAISRVLKGTDMAKKERLLLCLDKYLDPWFGYRLPYEDKIFELLQYMLIDTNTKDVKDDALDLLTSYGWPPFTILENNFDKIEANLLEDVKYVIAMDKCAK